MARVHKTNTNRDLAYGPFLTEYAYKTERVDAMFAVLVTASVGKPAVRVEFSREEAERLFLRLAGFIARDEREYLRDVITPERYIVESAAITALANDYNRRNGITVGETPSNG